MRADNAPSTVVFGRAAAVSVHQRCSLANVPPGEKLAVNRTGRPSASALSQWRDAFNVTGPLMPK
jgi:hypothetical protein